MDTASRFNLHTKAQRPMPVPAPIRNPLILFLLSASKTDSRLLSLCSHWAIATQAALGFFVFFTAILAFGASNYTVSTIIPSSPYTFWISLGWSLFVFFLDREIVGALDKVTAMVRPMLALFLGTLVAIPIELLVFQGRIDQDLQRQYRQDNKLQFDELRSAQTQLGKRLSDLQTTLDGLRKEEADWGKVMDDELVGRPKSGRTGQAGDGPVYRNAQEQQQAVRLRIKEVRRDLEQFERSMPIEQERLEKQFQRQEVGKVTDFVTRYEAMDKVIHSSDALWRLSWIITITLILIEMTPALLKLLTPHVDYHHLVAAEMRENQTRIDEISELNYRRAMVDPESPEFSVSEKFAIVRYGPAEFRERTDRVGRER